ncbi:MAG: trypsin-like peptidase domain-containing protein [Zoogloeaceae bacterium]|nr:trypsin-like peptidase domain-containing protein [Zoogloeaceae bacterium]
MTIPNTLYAALGVDPDASDETIAAAFRQREQQLQGEPDALSLLRVAYDTLRQPAQRAAYDRKLQASQAQAETRHTENTPPAVGLTLDYTPRHQPRSRARNWLVLLLAMGGTAGFFWLKTPSVAKQISTPPASVAASEETVPPQVATAPTEPVAAPIVDNSPAPVTEQTSTPAAFRAAPALPSRGTKQPGFDAQYLAWSVFTIRQRNLTGSGVMIGPDRILTNCHVLAGGATNGLVVINGMTKQVTKVEKYARLDGEDACLLLAPGAGSDAIAWGNSASLRAGDTVHAMGHPGGSSDIVWSEGAFRMRVDRGGETFLLSDTYCRPGSSGGPLLDNEGRLVGVVTAVQRFQAKGGDPQFGACISVTEATARALLSKPLFPIALAPAQYLPNY